MSNPTNAPLDAGVLEMISALKEAEVALRKQADALWSAYIAPKIEACTSREEVNAIRNAVSRACADLQMHELREMPFEWPVEFIMAVHAHPAKAEPQSSPKVS